ncbi:hypothetical protein EJ08DRAFT_605092 [Tothia fuscella]|uniref:Phosphoglycerate mutase family protein n=1 Tax=Tothia fuscella TaxID=1048955 RepID=A0A9P4P248_9PEZI|nr:hypothetical protein EJ08DRAFT_605092 [Tothia fuscella]
MLLPQTLLLLLVSISQFALSTSTLATRPKKSAKKPSTKPTVYFIRHGEKPSNGEDGLSTDGLRRAQCLRRVFNANSTFNIGHVIAQRPTADGSQGRPYDTVKPLSKDLGIKVDKKCDRDDIACVEKMVKHYSGPGNILICWEHTRMTNISAALGDENPPIFPGNDYHHIWEDPYPYTHVNNVLINQECPGLDTHPEDKYLIIGLVVVLVLGVIGAGVAFWKFRERDDDGYEVIE